MIMRPGKDGIIGHTLFYQDEIKQEYAFHADTSLIASKEMELAEKLVEALATPFDPAKFKDKFRERLQNAISVKVEAGAASAIEPGGDGKSVVNIMDALQASLKAVRKPVASASKSETNKTTPKKKSSGK